MTQYRAVFGALSLSNENKAPYTKGETSKEAAELKSSGKCGFISTPQMQMQAGLPKSRGWSAP